MHNFSRWKITEVIFFVIALFFILFLQGAMPFLMIPILAQAVWGTGFAESFTHGSIFAIHAHDFGLPKPAAISFGLAAAWSISLLLRFGLHAADAYSMITAMWMSIAFFSAFLVARNLGNSRSFSILGATVWMSMPIIWYHTGYGFLALGMCLLAFYFLAAIKLFFIDPSVKRLPRFNVILYFIAAILAVFIDGYTFMMFAVGATILFLFLVKTRIELRPMLWRKVFPVHIASFFLAYVLYALFIDKSNYGTSPIEFFRAWGVDLWFLAVPTAGFYWLSDILHLGAMRPRYMYFGDSSVWISTFALPIILAGVVAWLQLIRKKIKLATGFFLVAIFGFYMSLGPSLKIHTQKPLKLQINLPDQQSQAMLKRYAIMPTGNAVFSKYLPGFNDMRAAYRWTALEVFALWCLVMLAIVNTRRKRAWTFVLFVILLLNLPDMPKRFQLCRHYREMFLQIEQQLVPALQQFIQPNEIVVFLPWGNDWLVNYLAPTAGFLTYNIGGDKNMFSAYHDWPNDMRATGPGPLDVTKVSAGLSMLRNREADVLIIPYFDLLWGAHKWPCGRAPVLNDANPYACLLPYKKSLKALLDPIKASSEWQVTDSDLFMTIRVKPSPKE